MRWSKATYSSEMISVYDDDDSKALHIDRGRGVFSYCVGSLQLMRTTCLHGLCERVCLCIFPLLSGFRKIGIHTCPHFSTLLLPTVSYKHAD